MKKERGVTLGPLTKVTNDAPSPTLWAGVRLSRKLEAFISAGKEASQDSETAAPIKINASLSVLQSSGHTSTLLPERQ